MSKKKNSKKTSFKILEQMQSKNTPTIRDNKKAYNKAAFNKNSIPHGNFYRRGAK